MASATASDVISRALRRLNLISEVETMSADQSSAALAILNSMMHGFNTVGIAYAHSDLGLTDTVNVADENVADVVNMLVWELSADYGVALSKQLAMMINTSKRALQATYYQARRARVDRALVEGARTGMSGYNFDTDSYS